MKNYISKTFAFDAGHRLARHGGKCWNLHGHTYKVEVFISGEIDERTGMIVDFAQIKKDMKDVINELDHGMILNPIDKENIEHCRQWGYKIIILNDYGEPTAENIARYILSKNSLFSKIIVWETPTSKAEVCR